MAIIQDGKKKSVLMDAATIFLIVIISFLFSLQASNDIWWKGSAGPDSNVFKYVARVIQSGGMPYLDAFDHKGPLIYLLNVIGIQIAGWRGIWVLEWIAIFITFYFMYKIARIYTGRGMSVLLLLIGASPLFLYFEGGNLTEEFAMPFIAISIYIFADYFIHSFVNVFHLIVCGFSFGAILLLRPNMCAVWVVFCFGVLAHCIYKKDFKRIGPFIACFVGGALVLLIPVLVWLAVNGAFRAFVEDYILFNLQYSQAFMVGKVNAFIHFFNSGLILFAVCGLSYVCFCDKSYFDFLYLIYMLVTLLLICISGQKFDHYGMTLVPALSYPFARMVHILRGKISAAIVSDFFILYLIVVFAAPGWLGAVQNAAIKYAGRNELHFDAKEMEVVNMIAEHSTEEDRIIVLGNWNSIYNLSNRYAASKYSYQSPPLDIDRERAEEFYQSICENQPKLIVLPEGGFGYERMLCLIEENGYYAVGKTTDQTVTVYRKG